MKRIPSLRQIQASRRNGARSHGPSSNAGREKIKLNALDHGLTARTAVLPGESVARFETLLQRLYAEHAPASVTEELLIEQFAVAAWRLRRSAGFENAIISHEIPTNSPHPDPHTQLALTWADSQRVRLTARYEAAQHRAFRANLHDLLLVRNLCGDPAEPVEINETPSNQEFPGSSETLRNEPGPASHPPSEGPR